ncbi:ribonuclease D [Hoyosella sp. G463]|uniref:Ribonuclease D n=1 Tax=Lolliginicoccus lacisalsi TaxID=2742202 RepID=A0A927JB02_9ACTN|nr:ribonuclease D [Lolliginicoccus lacisalsi]MBD8505352.1 ribonuclease D [Lolliginicoccus lacisalsi]
MGASLGDNPPEPDTSPPVPLLAPRDGAPTLVSTPDALAAAVEALASGSGPLAVDAERASSYRYSARAYLVQLRRAGSGTILIDPIGLEGEFDDLAEVINPLEWILHAADQDLPGLAELGLRPARLFDTELASRLAGFERVGLAAVTERLLGLSLAKGHGSDDWSRRPLPAPWLNYAALDVEILIELRDILGDELAEQGKASWAAQEFEHVRTREPAPPNPQRWRRTTNIHTVRDRRGLAIVRELWLQRDRIAAGADIAPKRLLPDAALVAAANEQPATVAELLGLRSFNGPRQRRRASSWFAAIQRARAVPASELPPTRLPGDASGRGGTPRPRTGTDAAQRYTAMREALTAMSTTHAVPVENLLPSDLVRQLAFDPPEPLDVASVRSALIAGGARDWQAELVAEPIEKALQAAFPPEDKEVGTP